jgi:hypothetical protein
VETEQQWKPGLIMDAAEGASLAAFLETNWKPMNLYIHPSVSEAVSKTLVDYSE